MYNPAKPPFVTHFDGNRLIFDYIETFVCPTTTSASILGGQPFVFEGDAAATVRASCSRAASCSFSTGSFGEGSFSNLSFWGWRKSGLEAASRFSKLTRGNGVLDLIGELDWWVRIVVVGGQEAMAAAENALGVRVAGKNKSESALTEAVTVRG